MAISNSDFSDKFGSVEMYGGALTAVDDEGNEVSDGDRGEESLLSDADDVLEESDERPDGEDEALPYTDPNEVPAPDDLAVALNAAREEAAQAAQRAQFYQEQVAHLTNELQRPPTIPFHELNDEWRNYFETEAAKFGSDPANEYRLWQKEQDQQRQVAHHGARQGIVSHYASHPDYAEYGADVQRLLEEQAKRGDEVLLLSSYMPPEVMLRDATQRIDALFTQAKYERLVSAKRAEAQRDATKRAAEQRSAMKAATRGEPTRSSGVSGSTADTNSSRRTPADDIKAGVMRAARASRSLLS